MKEKMTTNTLLQQLEFIHVLTFLLRGRNRLSTPKHNSPNPPHRVALAQINVSHQNSLLLVQLTDDLSPWTHHHTVSISHVGTIHITRRRAEDDKRLRIHRTTLRQDVPVERSRRHVKGRGIHEHLAAQRRVGESTMKAMGSDYASSGKRMS